MTMTFKQLLAEAAKEKVDLRLAEVTDNGDEPVLATFAPANSGKGRTFTVEVDNYKTKVLNHGHFNQGTKEATADAKGMTFKKTASMGKTEAPIKPKEPPKKKAAAKKTAAKKTADTKNK